MRLLVIIIVDSFTLRCFACHRYPFVTGRDLFIYILYPYKTGRRYPIVAIILSMNEEKLLEHLLFYLIKSHINFVCTIFCVIFAYFQQNNSGYNDVNIFQIFTFLFAINRA